MFESYLPYESGNKIRHRVNCVFINEEFLYVDNMVLLENETFLSELTRLFRRSKTTGSLNITMKRYDGRTKPKPKTEKTGQTSHETLEYKCLLRATLGNKKISTVINQRDVNKFQMAYTSVLKGNMDGLKKRDKKTAKGKSKSKATQ